MRILLVVPPCNFLHQGYGVKLRVKIGQLPPLGVGYIASYLERDGHTLGILDCTAMELTINAAFERIAAFKPDLIGLSVLTNYADSARQLAALCKEAMPQTPIVVGGPHATYFFKDILDDMPAVDHVIYGEVDTVINDYVRFLAEPDRLKTLLGLVYRDANGEAVVNAAPPTITDMDTVPPPAWHLYEPSLYWPLPMQSRQRPVFTMITSRGCQWGRCTFCFQAGHSKAAFRRHSPKRVVDEIQELRDRFGIREIHFWDDTFIFDEVWMEQFVEEMARRHIDLSWTASGRVSAITERMVELLKRGGCWNVFLGIESGVEELLKSMKKGTTLKQARNALALLNRAGIQTRCAFMLGLPGETPALARETINFAIEIEPTYAIFYAAHPRAGTDLYDEALSAGRFLSSDYKGMSRITYVPEGYENAEQLSELIRLGYRRFYLRPAYLGRMLSRIKNLSDLRELFLAGVLYVGLSDTFNPLRKLAARILRPFGGIGGLAFGQRARGD